MARGGKKRSRSGSKAGMRFVVGSSAGVEEDSTTFDLRHELDLVKAALLYADRVELVSVGASLLSGWVALRDVSPKRRLILLRQYGGHELTPEQLEKMDLVMGERPRRGSAGLNDRERIQARIQLKAVADRGWEQLTRTVEEQFEAYNAQGLREAVASGLVTLHSFVHTDAEGLLRMATDMVPLRVAIDDVLHEYIEQASIAMEESGYPLFDDLIGQLVNEGIREGLITPLPTGTQRGRHGGLSGNLLGRLPLFEEASVGDILAIRRELQGSLRGFRVAVSEYSREIRSAAWERDFVEEVDLLFAERIGPKIQDIEEEVRENSSLRELAWRTARHGGTPATFGAIVGSVDSLASLAGVALGLGSGAAKALFERRDKGKEISGNQLYFYYRAGKLLARRASHRADRRQ